MPNMNFFPPPIITLVKLKLAIKNIQPTHSKLENFIKQSISHQTPEMNTIRFKILVSFLPQHFPSNQTLSLSERKRRKMKVQERESRQGKKNPPKGAFEDHKPAELLALQIKFQK